MDEELVRMQNVSKFYGSVQALKDVSLTVRRGEVVGRIWVRSISAFISGILFSVVTASWEAGASPGR